jgi:hypothetical protein
MCLMFLVAVDGLHVTDCMMHSICLSNKKCAGLHAENGSGRQITMRFIGSLHWFLELVFHVLAMGMGCAIPCFAGAAPRV